MILIPLGGTGQRFKQNGYKNPKAFYKCFWLSNYTLFIK